MKTHEMQGIYTWTQKVDDNVADTCVEYSSAMQVYNEYTKNEDEGW